MTESEFKRLASTYGGDLARWPPASRAAAGVLLRSALHLERLLRAERALDTHLQASAPLVNPARAEAAMAAVTAAIGSMPPVVPPSQERGWRSAQLAFLGCALLGFALGLWSPVTLFSTVKQQDIIAVLTGDKDAAIF